MGLPLYAVGEATKGLGRTIKHTSKVYDKVNNKNFDVSKINDKDIDKFKRHGIQFIGGVTDYVDLTKPKPTYSTQNQRPSYPQIKPVNNNQKYYEELGLEQDATKKEIKSAYRKMARKYHPDRGGSNAKFRRVQEAYEKLYFS